MTLNRRRFLRYLISLGLSLGLSPGHAFASPSSRVTPMSRVIPSSGERLPVIGMGSWKTFAIDPQDEQELRQREQVIREFFKFGGGMLDSSPMYGTSQLVIGQCLKRIGEYQGLFSATKVWINGTRAGFLQMEESRSRWGIEHFDLMQVHNLLDWKTHLPTLHEMKAAGQIRYVGVTTSHGSRHKKLIKIMRDHKLDFVQFTYNMLDREAEQYLLPMAAEKGIAVIINRPFQGGRLFDFVGNHPLPDWAAEIDCKSWAQYFLKFIVSHPGVTCAIPATTRVDHLQENMNAAYGHLPDQAMRKKMLEYIQEL